MHQQQQQHTRINTLDYKQQLCKNHFHSIINHYYCYIKCVYNANEKFNDTHSKLKWALTFINSTWNASNTNAKKTV